MADTAARLALRARRNEVCRFTIAVTGIDLTGVAMTMQIRVSRGSPGAPLIALGTVATLAAEGLKLDSVTVVDGLPTSIVKGRINQSTMTDATKVPYTGEVGDDTVFAYAMVWTLSGDTQTRLEGDFILQDSAYNSDNAPADRPQSYGYSARSSGLSSGSLTFGDQIIQVSINDAGLVAPLVAQAQQIVTDATAAIAAQVVTAQQASSDAQAAAALVAAPQVIGPVMTTGNTNTYGTIIRPVPVAQSGVATLSIKSSYAGTAKVQAFSFANGQFTLLRSVDFAVPANGATTTTIAVNQGEFLGGYFGTNTGATNGRMLLADTTKTDAVLFMAGAATIGTPFDAPGLTTNALFEFNFTISQPLASKADSRQSVILSAYASASSPALAFVDGLKGFLFDPTDLSTLWQDAARTIPVTGVGDVVGGITDKSGNGSHAFQNTDAAKPKLGLDRRGNYCLVFDGVDDCLFVPGANASIYSVTGNGTLITAVEAPSQNLKKLYTETLSTATLAATNFIQLGTGAAAISYGGPRGNTIPRVDTKSRSGGNTINAANVGVGFDKTARTVSLRYAARVGTLYLDGRQAAVAADYGVGGMKLDTVTIGGFLSSEGLLANAFFAGNIGRMVGVRGAVSDAQFESLRTWVRNPTVAVTKSLTGSDTSPVIPRAIALQSGKVICGSIAMDGVHIAELNVPQVPGSDAMVVNWGTPDGHDNPAIIRRSSDGRLLAVYSNHSTAQVVASVSINPEQALFALATAIGVSLNTKSFTYPQLYELLDFANQPVILFARSMNTNGGPSTLQYAKLSQSGIPSAALSAILTNDRCYFMTTRNTKLAPAGKVRIDIQASKTHPTDSPTNPMFGFYMLTDGTTETFYAQDGAQLAIPFDVTTLTPFYSAPAGQPQAWIGSIAIGPDGNPWMAIVQFFARPTAAGQPDDKRYLFSRWTGAAWTDPVQICTAGGGIDTDFVQGAGYSYGGMSFDPLDPSVIIVSRSVNGKPHQLWRYTTEDSGATWTGRQITFLPYKVFQPDFIRGATVEPRLVATIDELGLYNHYLSFEGVRTKLFNSGTGDLT